jgi:heme-degrading monooxygenase HmoA
MSSRPLPPTEIRTDAPWVTEITFLHCIDERQDVVVDAAITYARRLTDQPGSVATTVLRSTDRSRVCLYTQWENADAAAGAARAMGDPGWTDLVETDSGGARLYDVIYADDRSPGGVSTIPPKEPGVVFVNEIRTEPADQNRLLELVIANNEASSLHTPGYRSANFHRSHDGHRAVNYSLWDTEEHLIEAITEMAATDVNLEETVAIANPDFRFYTLAHAEHR